MNRRLFSIIIFSGVVLSACNNPAETTPQETVIAVDSAEVEVPSTDGVQHQGDLVLMPAIESPSFPDAKLTLKNPITGKNFPQGEVKFEFEVSGFELGEQTEDQNLKNLAFSKDGQHIHLILNNRPYMALYEPLHIEDLEEGAYLGIAFLSRSYHESVKWPSASIPFTFTVGNAEPIDHLLEQPLLFYSRPKGEYSKKEGENLLVDFYLVNANLSSGSENYKVRLTINDRETFTIPDWEPYVLKGLQPGKHTFKTELIDGNGNPVNPDYNTVSREITIKED